MCTGSASCHLGLVARIRAFASAKSLCTSSTDRGGCITRTRGQPLQRMVATVQADAEQVVARPREFRIRSARSRERSAMPPQRVRKAGGTQAQMSIDEQQELLDSLSALKTANESAQKRLRRTGVQCRRWRRSHRALDLPGLDLCGDADARGQRRGADQVVPTGVAVALLARLAKRHGILRQFRQRIVLAETAEDGFALTELGHYPNSRWTACPPQSRSRDWRTTWS